MKRITLLLLLVGMTGIAQIKGNNTIETRHFNVEGLEHIKINFYAKVTIDQSAKEAMSINTDSNLFDLIDTKVINGVLHLNQKEWISPSQKAIITIGAPNLKRLESGTHDTTKIINLNTDELRVNAPVGTIIIEGKTKELRLGSELATIDASKLIAENAYVNLWSRGKVTVNVTNLLWADVSNDGKLLYVQKPKKLETKTENGGRIYGNWEEMSVGLRGEYDYQAVMDMMGQGRTWVIHIRSSDPIPMSIQDNTIAELEVSQD